MPVSVIGLDADDTLWHHETHFRDTQESLLELLSPFADGPNIEVRLAAIEHRNLALYGYGVKGFTLSMLETALELSHGQVSGPVMREILGLGRDLLRHPIELLPGVADALPRLASLGRLVLITKGDLFHQEAKLAASGLGDHYAGVEIVSAKTPEVYARVFARHGAAASAALMAGNSVRSDILPALEAGGYAALIPYHLVWAHEAAEAPHGDPRFRELQSLGALPDWVASIG